VRRVVAGAMLLAVLLVACTGDGPEDGVTPPPTSPSAGTQGVAPDCVSGWSEPEPGTTRYRKPLGVLRRYLRVRSELAVEDMRYFEGPESPPSEVGYLKVVKRWYVRASLADDPTFQGRWLVEERYFGAGVVAASPHDSNEFRSPDWMGFEDPGGGRGRKTYEGLSGKYAGDPYDFVTGGDAFDFPGLPAEALGCLEGT